MIWNNCDSSSGGEEEAKTADSKSYLRAKKLSDENEQKGRGRLERLRDPSKDQSRKTYIAKVCRFGELLVANDYEEIVRGIMTEDCEIFLFNFGEMTPVQYALKPEGLADLYKHAKVIKREVKETNADSEAATAFQICYYEILNEQDQTTIPQFSLEIFSFKNDKISKYRSSFGSSMSFGELNNPFIASTKEKMLAKAKQFTYAWADQPDFERIVSLFDASTEYKIWRWDDNKSFTFDKSNFVKNFKNNLEVNYEIKYVVPHFVYSEGQYIISNFVFHLEGKSKSPGEKFVWLCNCIYTFDKCLNIIKIVQQGEFYRQDAIEVPFHVVPREAIRKGIGDYYASKVEKKEITLLDNSNMAYSIELSRFGPKDMMTVDHVKGFDELNKLYKVLEAKGGNYDWDKVVDFYMDYGDDSYDAIFTIECLKRSKKDTQNEENSVETIYYTAKKLYLEHGNIAKIAVFFSNIPETIPSPYDDHTFTTHNLKLKEDILEYNCKMG